MKRRITSRSVLMAACALLLLLPAAAAAQRVERGARGEPAIDRVLDRVVAGQYTVIRENRLIERDDTLRGTIVVANATLRVEGTIDGDLIGLDANLFLRPTAVVTGDVVNVVGGFYPSELATVHGTLLDAPNAPYTVRVTDDVVRVDGTDARPRFEWEGFRGVMMPSYDRVDGVTLGAGAAIVLPYVAGFDPRISAHGEYRSQRGVFTGGAALAAERGVLRIGGGAERTTRTNELWIRPRWNNALNYLFLGLDYHDHYEADRAWGEVALRQPIGDLEATLSARLQIEEATSLRAGNPWSLLRRDEVRANRPVDDGRITSGTVSASARYAGYTITVDGGAGVEFGRFRAAAGEPAAVDTVLASAPPFADGGFALGNAWADVQMAAFREHTLRVTARVQAPLPGTDALPLQRWTMVGGDGTLYTHPIGAFHGDRMAWIHSRYAVPFPDALRLPLLGPPTFELLHVAAMAWADGEAGALEQNVGARLRAGFVFVRWMVDPSGDARRELAVGFTMPLRSLPWQGFGDGSGF